MKIYAKQIDPEYMDPFMDDEMFNDIMVFGNRDYKIHINEFFERVLTVLREGELADILDDIKLFPEYKNITEAITDLLPPESPIQGYSKNDIHLLKMLVLDYAHKSCSEERKLFCQVLTVVSGKIWDYREITGYMQSEWNYIYFIADEWDSQSLDTFEKMYFNMGTEWIIHDDYYDAPSGPEDIHGYSMYCVTDDVRKEIAEATEVDPKDVVLYKFAGYKRIPIYEEESE